MNSSTMAPTTEPREAGARAHLVQAQRLADEAGGEGAGDAEQRRHDDAEGLRAGRHGPGDQPTTKPTRAVQRKCIVVPRW